MVAALALAAALVGPVAGASESAVVAEPEPAKVRWQVQVDLDYFEHDLGIGPDGTIYLPNKFGRTQAIDPVDGSTKWVAEYGGGGGPITVGKDGTIYTAGGGAGTVGGTDSISALRPDGSLKWMFTGTEDGLIAGPNVGPDGNVYAVTDVAGIGFFSLTPTGDLRFATGEFTDYGPRGMNIAFGPNRAYFGFDMFGLAPGALFAYDFGGNLRWTLGSPGDPPSPAAGPNGNVVFLAFPSRVGRSVWSFTPAGEPVYKFYEFPGNVQSAPDVGVDDVAYVTRNLSTLLALAPDGTVRWRSTIDGIMFEPRVNLQNTVVVVGGRTAYGASGFVRAVTTTGHELFRIPLPDEPGFEPYGQLVPSSRPAFSPDGSTAYLVADVAGDGNVPYADTYAYLYAVDTATTAEPATAPAAPTNLRARARAATRVDLTWRDASLNEAGFAIERCRGATCTGFVEVATVAPDVTRWTDRDLRRGSYRYRVLAFNTHGDSAYSNRARVHLN